MIDMALLMQLSYGMYIVGADDSGRPTGCIVNAVIQITNENPIIAVSMNKDNYTYDVIKRTGKFSLSILSEQCDAQTIAKFGFHSGRTVDKFADIPYEMADGVPILKHLCTGYLTCNVLQMVESETHFVILARVASTIDGPDKVPMTYDYYHTVIKGKAPKNAPTYLPPAPKPKKISYVCPVCGYVYEGDITQEPDDYVCPLCGVPRDQFVKQ